MILQSIRKIYSPAWIPVAPKPAAARRGADTSAGAIITTALVAIPALLIGFRDTQLTAYRCGFEIQSKY